MEREIFAPSGMTSASVLDRRRVIRGRADVYSLREGVIVKWGRDWRYELPSFFGVFASLRDVVRFDQAWSSGRLVKAATRDAMWSPARLTNGDNATVAGKLYGLGWELGEHRGHRVAEHSGASGTSLLKFIDDGLTVVVLGNLDVPSGSRPALLARTIAGETDARLLPPHRLPPQRDEDPTLIAVIQQIVADLAAGRTPAALTDWGKRQDARLPPRRVSPPRSSHRASPSSPTSAAIPYRRPFLQANPSPASRTTWGCWNGERCISRSGLPRIVASRA